MNFEDTMRAAGLIPKAIVADGRIRRCGTDAKPRSDNGWYVLHPDGHGVFGDWASGHGQPLGTWKDERGSMSVDPAAVARTEARRTQERLDRVIAWKAMRRYWMAATVLKEQHPYLDRKGLSLVGCHGLREHDGWLLVPVLAGDRMLSVQKINREGEKKFWPKLQVKAGAFILDRQTAPISVIAEGLATGLAVFQCVPFARVIVAFDCGNMSAVVERMQLTGAVVVAADNDWRTEIKRGFNPGLEAARAVADRHGFGVAYPDDIDGTDWADAMAQWGERAAKRIDRLIRAAVQYATGEIT